MISTPRSSTSVERLSLDQYRAFLAGDALRGNTLYHDPAWLETVQVGLGMDVALLGILDRDQLTAVVPGFVAGRWGVRLFGSPLRGSMTPYLGWVTTAATQLSDREILAAVHRFSTSELGAQYAEIGLLEPASDVSDDATATGWRQASRETYMLDLGIGEEALWSNLGHRHRGKVRKAQREGITVDSVASRDAMDVLYPLIESAYARHHAVSPHPRKFFFALHDRLVHRGMMTVFAARYRGEIISIALVLHDQRDARCMSVGSRPEFHHLYPNNVLHWHIIAWATARGLSRYDFGGKGQASIDRFKESFKPVPYAYTFFWRASPAVAWARNLALRAWPGVQMCRYQARRLRALAGNLIGQSLTHPRQREQE